MSTNRIMTALTVATQKPPLPSGTVLVCRATEDEWNAIVDRHDLPIKANWLQWFAETNEIHIVEIGCSHTHESIVVSLHDSFRSDTVVRHWLGAAGASKNTTGPASMPDLSFGPKPIVPGVQLPAAILWENFKTIKVEIGVSQQWGLHQYVLCIKTDDRLTQAHYKLYDVVSNDPAALATADPATVEIVPGTRVHFDARRILGIPLGAPPPAGFPDPFVVDLFAALEEARTNLPPK